MSYPRQVLAAIFDMDGLLIDSEPLWEQAEMEIFSQLDIVFPGGVKCLTQWDCVSIRS